MKKYILIVAALSLVAISKVNAQGVFNFANGASGVNAPIFETDGTTKLAGSAYLADYFWGPAGASSPSQLTTDGGLAQAFSTGGNAGYFFGGSQAINGQTGTVTIQVRAWRASDGASWAAASAVNGAALGQGNLLQVALATGTVQTPNLVGLTSFNLVAGPEPATMALGLMGAGALFIRRRKA